MTSADANDGSHLMIGVQGSGFFKHLCGRIIASQSPTVLNDPQFFDLNALEQFRVSNAFQIGQSGIALALEG